MSRTKNTTAIVIASVESHVACLIERRSPQRREREIVTAVRFRILFFQPLRNCVKAQRPPAVALNARLEKCVAFDPTRSAVFQLVTGAIESLLHRRPEPKN